MGTLAKQGTSKGLWMTSVSDMLVGSVPKSKISGYVCNYDIAGKS